MKVHFLLSLVVLFTVGTIGPATTLQAAEGLPNPFFGMDTSVRNLTGLQRLKDLGYAGISWKLEPPETLTATVKKLRERDLKLFAIYGGANLTKKELTWSADLEADLAPLKGTEAIIWLPIFSREFACSATEGDDIAVPALVRLADHAAEHGVRVAIYPHKGAWAERLQDALRLVKKANRKNLGVTFNLCHCLMVGDEARMPELLEQAAPHLFLVTINGADAGAAGANWNQLIRPLGEGNYDVGLVLSKLRALDYQGPIGLQGYGIKLPAEENLRRSMEAWKKLSGVAP